MQRHETVVEISKSHVEEMLRAFVMAKYQIAATQFHEIRLTVMSDKFVVRVIDPPAAPGAHRG